MSSGIVSHSGSLNTGNITTLREDNSADNTVALSLDVVGPCRVHTFKMRFPDASATSSDLLTFTNNGFQELGGTGSAGEAMNGLDVYVEQFTKPFVVAEGITAVLAYANANNEEYFVELDIETV